MVMTARWYIMKVDVCLYASLASRLPEHSEGNTASLELPDGTSVAALLSQLEILPDEPKIIFRNGIHAKPDDVIKDGDRIAVFPPVAGG
jgi:sulfur carrier protein ThiS